MLVIGAAPSAPNKTGCEGARSGSPGSASCQGSFFGNGVATNKTEPLWRRGLRIGRPRWAFR
jgi:hypothetical protein